MECSSIESAIYQSGRELATILHTPRTPGRTAPPRPRAVQQAGRSGRTAAAVRTHDAGHRRAAAPAAHCSGSQRVRQARVPYQARCAFHRRLRCRPRPVLEQQLLPTCAQKRPQVPPSCLDGTRLALVALRIVYSCAREATTERPTVDTCARAVLGWVALATMKLLFCPTAAVVTSPSRMHRGCTASPWETSSCWT
eukprot:COSAG05_NODE_2414_length_3093_cov_4.084900_3_plen_196_part_00